MSTANPPPRRRKYSVKKDSPEPEEPDYNHEISNLDFDAAHWHQYFTAAKEDDEKEATRPCPTLSTHLASFSSIELTMASVSSITKRFNANIIPTYPFWNYGDYVLLHPDFHHAHGNPRNRTNGVLFIKYVFLGGKTKTHHAVIRFDYRCRFCIIKGNLVYPGIRRTPCFDPFIEARDKRLDFEFPGIVAFANYRTRQYVMREHWCWSTLREEREVIAVYSKMDIKHNLLKRGWIKVKFRNLYSADDEVKKISYIEDLILMGFKERQNGKVVDPLAMVDEYR